MTRKFRFTHERLQVIECADDKTEQIFYDDLQPALALRVTKAGAKSFVVMKKIGGKTRRKTLGKYTPAVKLPAMRDRALKELAGLEEDVRQTEEKKLKDEYTLEAVFRRMLAAKRYKITQTTVSDYERTFKNYLSPYAERTLISITSEEVIKIHSDVTDPVVQKNGKIGKPRTRAANKTIVLLRMIFNFAILVSVKDGKRLISYNPCDAMKVLDLWHEERRTKIRIGQEELKPFIQSCIEITAEGPLRDVPVGFESASSAVLFMLFTGVRPDEVSKIRKEYIDHSTRSIIFPERTKDNELDTLKNGKEYHLVLNDSAYCQILHASKHSKSQYVFSGVELERLPLSNLRDYLIKIGDRVNRKYTPKIMRATFISLCESVGLSTYQTKLLCNHSGAGQSIDVTDGYKSMQLNEVRQAAEKVERKILELANLDKDYVCRGHLDTLVALDELTMRRKMVA